MKNNGYHSRSPEEFREYLDNLGKNSRKKQMKNLIIFFDIVLVILIFYVVNRTLNPEWNVKKSKKISTELIEMYLTRMVESEQDTVSYFLMVQNKGKDPINFPNTDDKFNFSFKAKNGLDCINKPISFETQNLSTGKTGYFAIEMEKKQFESMPPDCKSLLRNSGDKKFKNIFSTRSNGTVSLEIKTDYLQKTNTLSIDKESW